MIHKMPHLESNSTADAELLCKRCNEQQAAHRIRSEQVCQKCFTQYVTTKAVKRMETYRVRGSTVNTPRKLLLPLSFGPSSASLLQILDQHLQGQYDRMSRAAYEIFVVHIDLFVDATDIQDSATLLEKYKTRFPRHNYSSLGLDQSLVLNGIDWSALNLPGPIEAGSEEPSRERLQQVIGSMSSATSRADIISTLLTRLLVDVAKRKDCESILFGHSTTRLAERTLTETAKGRGFSLPWQVSDGKSPYGIGFKYPLRDLLRKELITFASLAAPPLTDLIIYQAPSTQISASSKTTTIDDLMAQYFESVEETYPSIVANVVRTSSKLKASTDNATGCRFCGLPVTEGTDGIYGWGGDQNSTSRPARDIENDKILCYGCSRSVG